MQANRSEHFNNVLKPLAFFPFNSITVSFKHYCDSNDYCSGKYLHHITAEQQQSTSTKPVFCIWLSATLDFEAGAPRCRAAGGAGWRSTSSLCRRTANKDVLRCHDW